MRAHNFFIEHEPDGLTYDVDRPEQLDTELITRLRAGPVLGRSDIEIAVPLARLVHDELELYGTSGKEHLSEEEMRAALRALRAVLKRLGVAAFDPDFNDFSGFRTYWTRNDGYGSWQVRRDLLSDLFTRLHDQLADLEDQALSSTLVRPVTSHPRTGWPAVDEEVGELRRHFANARTVQDYRGVGNDCVHLAEALSRKVFDPHRHLRPGEEVPPVANTKQRIERYTRTPSQVGTTPCSASSRGPLSRWDRRSNTVRRRHGETLASPPTP